MYSPMKIKHLILLTTTAVAASSLSSCSYDDYVITREEQYARDFIKTFGLIAEGHDWTAAQHTDVTVKTQTSTKVKIYADYNGETYIFGNYDVNPGSSTLKFDIPKGATNICLKANDRKIAFTPGQTVDLASASRSLNTAGGPGVTIELLPDEREGGGVNYLTLEKSTITKFTEVLEESEEKPSNPELVNLFIQKERITENFLAKATTFWIFPEYWWTESYDKNTIGVYYHCNENDTGAEKVIDIDGEESWIVKTPIYFPSTPTQEVQHPTIVTNLFQVTADLIYMTNDWNQFYEKVFDQLKLQLNNNKLPDGWDVAITDGSSNYKDIYGSTFSSGVKVLRFPSEEIYCNFQYPSNWKDVAYKDKENCKIIAEATNRAYPTYAAYFDDQGTYFNITGYIPETVQESLINTGNVDWTYPTYYKSQGIQITFDGEKTFGFYIERGGLTKYSEAKFNETLLYNNAPYAQACYVCTFTHGTDSYGNTLRRLCFEDWWSDARPDAYGKPGSCNFGDNTNFDMNDMVFRVYGFDEMDNHPDVTPGEIDEDPDEPKKEEDKPFRWIVACEDLGGADDYDFNDVVFGVEHVGGEREVYVTALAAGGTLEIHLMFNGTEVKGGAKKDTYGDAEFGQYTADGSGKTFDEWHKWFGSSLFSNMINTKSFSKVGATVVLVLPKDNNFTMANYSALDKSYKFGGFSVKVINNNQEITEISAPAINDEVGVDKGNIFPQMFVTTVDYKWPTERTSIYYSHQGDKSKKFKDITLYGSTYTVYENSFHHWVQTNCDEFHKQKPTGSVINHGWKGYKK